MYSNLKEVIPDTFFERSNQQTLGTLKHNQIPLFVRINTGEIVFFLATILRIIWDRIGKAENKYYITIFLSLHHNGKEKEIQIKFVSSVCQVSCYPWSCWFGIELFVHVMCTYV